MFDRITTTVSRVLGATCSAAILAEGARRQMYGSAPTVWPSDTQRADRDEKAAIRLFLSRR